MRGVDKKRKKDGTDTSGSSVKRFKLGSGKGNRKKGRSISVKSKSDKFEKCMITGIAVVNEETLAVTDWYNEKVKLVDIARGVVTDEIRLSAPWDLTTLPDVHLAVTLVKGKKIQILSLGERLTKRRTISVSGCCRGITYFEEKLVVSYEEDEKVEILTLTGKVLQCFKTNNRGKALFKWPLHVAVSRDGNFIYVSDPAVNSVVKLSFHDGKVIATYTDKSFKGASPGQLAVCEDGSVFVSNPFNSSVQVITPGCKHLQMFLGEKDGVGNCLVMCSSNNSDTLYVSDDDHNVIQMYKMK